MVLFRTIIAAMMLLGAVTARAGPPVQPADENTYVAGEILVCFVAGSSEDEIESIENTHGLVRLHEVPHLRIRHYRLPQGVTVPDAIAALTPIPQVQYAEPNYIHRLQGIPSDPDFSEQWGLHNMGQVVNGKSGPADADIDWPEAMDLYAPVASVVVAVIDSGVAVDHPELFDNIWVNTAELDDGIDNDGNGYVDDLFGWDFFDGDNLPLDEFGHGTLVASVVAGIAENGMGGVGVSPQATIMALRVADDFGSLGSLGATVANFLLSTTYAAQMRASVINYSAGRVGAFSAAEHDQLAWLNAQGVLFVSSAGNGGLDGLGDDNDAVPTYPASYDLPNILAVAATDRSDGLAVFSNFGAVSVDLAAPGTDIFGADVTRSAVFAEDFETGAPGWTVGSNCPFGCNSWSLFLDVGGNTWANDSMDLLSGAPLTYLPFADTWLESPWLALPLVGPQLRFRTWFEIASGDAATVEITTDGFTWQLVGGIAGPLTLVTDPPWLAPGAGIILPVDLSALAGQTAKLRFRLQSDGAFEADGAYVDDVSLSQIDVFSFDGTQFTFRDGTSFSAPLVAGVTALIWSQQPTYSHREVRFILLQSVDRPAALAGRLATSGRLNAAAAMQAVVAVPEPQTWLLRLPGAALLSLLARRRTRRR